VNILTCPPPFKSQNYSTCKVKSLYIGKKNTVQNLVEKITSIYQTLYKCQQENVNTSSCQLWKLDPEEDHNLLVHIVQETQGEVLIRAVKLNPDTILDVRE